MTTRCAPGNRGFTLPELLVVILIIALVSAATLPVVLPALEHRQVGEATRLLQAGLAGARDQAIRANEPRGIRLLPEPFASTGNAVWPPLIYSRFIPIEPAPNYTEGRVSIYLTPVPNPGTGNEPPLALRLEEEPFSASGSRNAPTSWYWNIRVGEKVRLGSGRVYTIVGPMWYGPASTTVPNPEKFVNIGAPGTLPPVRTYSNGSTYYPEYLLLVNGQDDNQNGLVDEGFDGYDNNRNGVIDEFLPLAASEWEPEAWEGLQFNKIGTLGATTFSSQPYVILRRPVPSQGAREVTLPSNIVIDATTWSAANPERSRLPIDPASLFVDILIASNGQVVQGGANAAYGPSLGLPFYHFWLTERDDIFDGIDQSKLGVPYLLPMPKGTNGYPNASDSNPRFLAADRRLVTLFTKTGQIVANTIENFDASATGLGVSTPFVDAQSGTQEEVR